MDRNSRLYTEVTPSSFTWEREAIDFVREGLPEHEPYRLWSNFEFVADDGSINEVDLLAVTPAGVFLLEIKSRPGIVTGDQQTLEWHGENHRVVTADNPLLLTNRKAKKLKSLLSGTRAYAKERKLPFIQPKLFLSHESNALQGIDDALRANIHLRDIAPGEQPDRFRNGRQGILHAITSTEQRRIDKPMAKTLVRALEEIGLRQSTSGKRVGDWRLEELLFDTPHYQDWSAQHASLDGETARIRIYQVERSASEEERAQRTQAARREFKILEGIDHEGFVRAKHFTEHESGPALVFEHFPKAQRLDHYLKQRGKVLTPDTRLHLLRSLAETVAYAHEKKLVHRALAPSCVLMLDPDSSTPSLKIMNWQTGTREVGTSLIARPTLFGLSGTQHVGQLAEDQSLVYIAPEVHTLAGDVEETADVFSLGAIAFHLFAHQPPAENAVALEKLLRERGALDLATAADGIIDELDLLVDAATQVDVSRRLSSAVAFLEQLEVIEDVLTRPEPDKQLVADPTKAIKGDRLDHGLVVERRLGKGSSAVALLVRREDKPYVLKVALNEDHSSRMLDEASALEKLRSPRVVELFETLHFGPRVGLLLQWASEGSLAERIRTNGAEQPELLERFGNDLFEAVAHLEERGISHRDIKPENLGVVEAGRANERHLLLFDFSLTRTAPENISAGTTGYLDPFLKDRGRWDVHAERFAVAVTLYHMATGLLPQWGDGKSAPWAIQDEVRLEPELFVPALRESMIKFFGKALRRDYRKRFDTTEEMRQAWMQVFTERAGAGTEIGGEVGIEDAELTTLASLLAPSTRAQHGLERAGVETVEDWLRIPLSRLTILRGVGSKTRRELLEYRQALQARFPEVQADPQWRPRRARDPHPDPVTTDQSVDELVKLLWPKRIDKRSQPSVLAMRALVALDPFEGASAWPSQSEVADAVGVTRARIGQILAQFRDRWVRESALTTVRDDIARLLDESGGVMTSNELAEALASLRGGVATGQELQRSSRALVRAALEAESERAQPRWVQRRPRSGHALFVALHQVEDDGQTIRDGNAANEYAVRLGSAADEVAAADPLLGPDRVLERLQAVARPSSLPALTAMRLRALATAASEHAAVSWRQEIYPRHMSAERALRLALGAVSATRQCTEDELRQRVASRYPEAELLPSRPALDALLKSLGSGLEWNGEDQRYVQRTELPTSYRPHTTLTPLPANTLTDLEYERREFDRKLRASLKAGAFVALNVATKDAERVRAHLGEHFDVDVWSVDDLLLDAMHRQSADLGPNVWETVRRADAERPHGDERESKNWRNLRTKVVDRAVPAMLDRIHQHSRPLLLVHPGLLARYGHAQLVVEKLLNPPKGAAPHRAVWLLVAGTPGEHPKIDDQPLPLFQNSQWIDVPRHLIGHRESTPADDA